MDLKTKLRYQGYSATPLLWEGKRLPPFEQTSLAKHTDSLDEAIVFTNKRLGKLVEEFVFFQVKHQPTVTWISDNLQIQDSNRTVGEIDALYFHDGHPRHLEISYKFYLYDTLQSYNDPLAYWIGPNRKDTLFYKLEKIRNKQFPLLHSDFTKPYLDKFKLDPEKIKQELCFKAQLFLPYHKMDMDTSPLSSDCIAGFYISIREVEQFESFEFYVPVKLDWLIIPHQEVNWLSYSAALEIIKSHIANQRSPLVWIKQGDGTINKCFIVFW